MGKKRIIKKSSQEGSMADAKNRLLSRLPKRKIAKGMLYINATYNNTHLTLTDEKGDVVSWGSSGAMGFSGTKKGTPYAASKVAGILGEKAKLLGLREIDIIIKGVGAGRESAIRSFIANGNGIEVGIIKDATPIPHNGPKPPKPRRV